LVLFLGARSVGTRDVVHSRECGIMDDILIYELSVLDVIIDLVVVDHQHRPIRLRFGDGIITELTVIDEICLFIDLDIKHIVTR
jgi:hypothetical protein